MSSQANAEQVDRAIDKARQALAADDSSARGWHDLGILYQLRGALAESRDAFERAAVREPGYASAHNNLANIYMRLGEGERAIESYRRALACDPNLMAAHANAAAVLHVLGRNAEALEHARRAVALDPSSTAARITAAFAEGALNGFDVAAAQIEALLTGTPDDPALLAAHAYCLLRLERFDAALAAAERGLAQRPDSGALLESLGCAQRGLGRFEAALTTFDRALAHGLDRAQVLVLKASTLLEVGNLDEAGRTLEAALAIAPDLASAWGPLVELRGFAPGDPALATMEGFLANSPRLHALEPRTLMHFALGKAYRKSGDHRNAFRHFAAGNALKRGQIVYDVAVDERFARNAISFYTPEAMQRLGGAGHASRAPIFVIGMPRSGTSLIEHILASHPDVYGAGELTFFDRAIAEVGTDDLTALGARYLALVESIAPTTKRVVDKLPSNFRHVALIHLALPRARIVHCVRNPLDTCFSCYTTMFTGRQDFSWDLTEAGRYHRAYAALMDHWRAVLPPGVMLDVRYEDVIADLEANARRMLEFCGLAWNDAVLRFYETSRPIRTASYRQARQPIYTTSIRATDAYRTELQPLIEALAPLPG